MASQSTTPDPASALLAQLETGVKAIQGSDLFQHVLDVQARFHNYSWGNSLLIALQCPDAKRVAGFNTWRDLGRHVRKGEKAIRILAPMAVVHRRKDGDDDAEEVSRVLRFKSVCVFDISQTDGKDLPEIAPLLTGDDGADLYQALAALARAEGVTVHQSPERVTSGDDGAGYYRPSDKNIIVKSAAQAQMTKTLAHELAHYWHDKLGGLSGSTREEAETIAEGVAYVVCGHFGLDTADRSFGYVAHWATQPDVLKRVLGLIQKISHEIIRTLPGENQQPARKSA